VVFYIQDEWYATSAGCAGVAMFRMNGQKIASAFSALPPSMAVVCNEHMTCNKHPRNNYPITKEN
jgi:hypothetical protein